MPPYFSPFPQVKKGRPKKENFWEGPKIEKFKTLLRFFQPQFP